MSSRTIRRVLSKIGKMRPVRQNVDSLTAIVAAVNGDQIDVVNLGNAVRDAGNTASGDFPSAATAFIADYRDIASLSASGSVTITVDTEWPYGSLPEATLTQYLLFLVDNCTITPS